jgi:hypothetical protein
VHTIALVLEITEHPDLLTPQDIEVGGAGPNPTVCSYDEVRQSVTSKAMQSKA